MHSKNDLDAILDTFQVEDVTDNPDKLHLALSLAAELYARLSSNNPQIDDVYQELLQDSYQKHGYARTVLLTGYNPSTDSIEILGTGRAIRGPDKSQDPTLTPLEAMQLVGTVGGAICSAKGLI